MQSTSVSHYAATDQLIRKWLSDRQAVIVTLNHLCGLRPFSTQSIKEEIAEVLQGFCEKLVDYVSYGHFSIYEKMIAVTERSYHPLARVPSQLIELLNHMTQEALDFADKCQKCDLHFLENELSTLAEKFAQRLEWEDKLIGAYSFAKKWGIDAIKSA